VKLMPAANVRPFVKSNKNDYVDAEAIAEAVQRPTMRFVPIKNEHSWIFRPCTACGIAGLAEEPRSSIRSVGFCWNTVLMSPWGRLISSERFLPFLKTLTTCSRRACELS
jgi:hypothetical protein